MWNWNIYKSEIVGVQYDSALLIGRVAVPSLQILKIEIWVSGGAATNQNISNKGLTKAR